MKDATEIPILQRLKQASNSASDTELADNLKLTKQSIAQARSKNSVPPSWILKVAEIYNISSDWLFFGRGPMRPEEPAQPAANAPEPPVNTTETTGQCPRCAKMEAKMEKMEQQRDELAQENRQLLRENGDLREENATMRERLRVSADKRMVGRETA